jgi:hypothetical protein
MFAQTVDLQRQLRAANNTNSRPRDKNQRFENEIKLSKQKVAELEQRNNDLKITNKEVPKKIPMRRIFSLPNFAVQSAISWAMKSVKIHQSSLRRTLGD